MSIDDRIVGSIELARAWNRPIYKTNIGPVRVPYPGEEKQMSSTETLTAEQLAQRLEMIASRLRASPPPGVVRRPQINIDWFCYTENTGATRDQVRYWTHKMFGPTRDKPGQCWIGSDNGDGIELTVFVRSTDEEAAK